MTVTVKLFVFFRQLFPEYPEGILTLRLDSSQTVKDLIDILQLPLDTPKIIFVNGTITGLDTALHQGDTISIFPHIAGG